MIALQLLLSAGVRLATPIAFAALGETISQKSGMLNLSLTAMMTAGAFSAVMGTFITGNPLLGSIFGVIAGVLIAVVQAGASIGLKASQVLVGLALHIAVIGATSTAWRGLRETVVTVEKLNPIALPFLSQIPFIGPILFEQRPFVYLLYILVPLLTIGIKQTSFGLKLQAVGEAPEVAHSSGIPVNKIRFISVLICGALAGLGGAYISISELGTFSEGMIAGRGWIAIAAVIFGGWKPNRVLAASFMFGITDALRFALPQRGVDLPSPLLTMLPFVVALLALAGLSKVSGRPSALTKPFIRSS